MNNKVYDIINAKIFELLETGTVPWHKPWNSSTSMPKNLVSKRPYSGLNLFILANQPYGSPYWLTYNACTSIGGNVKRGSKSTPVVFWKMLDKSNQSQESETTKNGKIPLLRYYSVFNTEQCEGISIPPTTEIINPFTKIERAEQIINNMPLPPEIIHGGGKAYYSIATDEVHLPPQTAFESPDEYYVTAFHEISHATLAEHRLNRKATTQVQRWGDEAYSKAWYAKRRRYINE